MREYFTLIRLLLPILVLLGVSNLSNASESVAQDTGHVVAQLVSSHDQVAPGQDFYLSLVTTMDDHWHVYWKNPGDAGEPVAIHWSDDVTSDIGGFVWPMPNPILTGPIMNYGFDGRVFFPMPATMRVDAQPGSVETFDAEVTYLVCEEVCVPEYAELSIQIGVGEPLLDNRWSYNIEAALAEAPLESGANAQAALKNGQLRLNFEIDVAEVEGAYFFPEEPGLINHSAPQVLTFGERGLRIEVESSFGLEDGLKGPIRGVLRTENKSGEASGVWITAKPGTKVDLGKLSQPVSGKLATNSMTLWTAVMAAFVGGLILNLMPCVFPVISMKALSFAKHAHEDSGIIRRQGWMYTIGVLATFLFLTIILLILKAAGSKVGWGFQLQNPVVIGVLALLFFAIGLNLLGVFDIQSRWQNKGNKLAARGGNLGAFFTGVLAVLVATPCTAPFMAGAIGFAMVQPAFITLLVFVALGLGFALPFLALSYRPGLLRALPKPGPWMERFKQFMAFFMFAAVIWLVWVLSFQTSETGIAQALAAMLVFGFGVFLLQGSNNSNKAFMAAAFLSSIALILTLKPVAQASTNLTSEAWSPGKVAELRAEGKNVFVDFTAAWCVTCKVNEQLVLNSSGELFDKYNTAVLVADWTNKNDEIADELASYGRSGVPLYLLFPAGDNPARAEILPQILTKSVLHSALERQ